MKQVTDGKAKREAGAPGSGRDEGRFARWTTRYINGLLQWEAAKPSRAGRACYRAYTQLFVPLAILVLISLPLSGRELIWNVDGLNQYYAFFIYEGEWIRGIVAGLLSGDGLNVPLWEWQSGYGADVPTTFDVFLDPLNLVSAITPPAVSEWVFQLLVVARLYLAGLAFTFYCRTRDENRTGTVLGALLYALCGTGLVGVRWASGLHAFILFPVVLAGAERVLAKGRPWVFIASFTALAVVSYYFTFTACILLVAYLALRVVMVERPNLTAGRFLRWVGVFAGLSALCAVLAAFALVPAAVALLGMDRFVDGQAVVPLLYSPGYYISLASSFLSTSDAVSDIYLGYGGLALFGCVALFLRRGEVEGESVGESGGAPVQVASSDLSAPTGTTSIDPSAPVDGRTLGLQLLGGQALSNQEAPDRLRKRLRILPSTGAAGNEDGDSGFASPGATSGASPSPNRSNRELKWVFVILSAFFLFPAVGSFFNGMNYPTNRWAWAYTLCVAYALARTAPTLLSLRAGEKRVMATVSVAYAFFFLIPDFRTEANVAGFAALLVALMVLVVDMQAAARRATLGCALALTLVVNGFYFLAPSEGGQGSGEVPLASAYAKLTSGSADSVALDSGDDAWWRYDAAQASFYAHAPMNRIANNSLVLGLNGIDFYNTVYDSAVDAFHTELAVAGDNMNFRYTNLQGRADLMALLGVKYYAYRNDGTDTAPYGFDPAAAVAQRSILGVDYLLAPAKSWLPVGFAFDEAITRSDYLALSPIQRQQALLQAVVLDDAARSEGGRVGGGESFGEAPVSESGAAGAGESDGEGAANGLSGGEAGAGTSSSAHPPEAGAGGSGRTSESGARLVGASSLSFEDRAIPFTVESSAGVAMEDGRFVVQAPGSSITLACEGVANAETYVYVDGLHLVQLPPSQLAGDAPESEPWYYRAYRIAQDLAFKPVSDYEIAFQSDAAAMAGYVFNDVEGTHTYGGKDEWLVNLGYSEQPVRTVTISFNRAGVYEFSGFQVLAETHEELDAQVAVLQAAVLEDVEMGCNVLAGSIDLDGPKTLLVTVARPNGWTAYVDGQPADLLRADTAFMGLDLAAGHHDIELRYFTPGLAEGFVLTGAGVVVVAAMALVLRRRKPTNVEKGHMWKRVRPFSTSDEREGS